MSDPDCLILDEPVARSGRANMAVDRWLLEAVCSGHIRALVRLYRWNEPTVSVGFSQRPNRASGAIKSANEIPTALKNCPQVERLSGGGAILHDHEITYCVALNPSVRVTDSPLELYAAVHRKLIECLESRGASLRLRGDAASDGPEAFLCFLRQDPNDVVTADGSCKVIGSAQRRRRGSLIQHGSILLRGSRLTPEIPGLSELFPAFSEQGLQAEAAHAVAQMFGNPQPCPPEFVSAVQSVADETDAGGCSAETTE